MNDPSQAIGPRVLVIGMAGSGKSTFSLALSAETGLPVIHLDLHYWKPGWVKPSDEEWREMQRCLLAGEAWIADGNYYQTLDLQLDRGNRHRSGHAVVDMRGSCVRTRASEARWRDARGLQGVGETTVAR